MVVNGILQRSWAVVPLVAVSGVNTVIIPKIKDESAKQIYSSLCLILAIWAVSYLLLSPITEAIKSGKED